MSGTGSIDYLVYKKDDMDRVPTEMRNLVITTIYVMGFMRY